MRYCQPIPFNFLATPCAIWQYSTVARHKKYAHNTCVCMCMYVYKCVYTLNSMYMQIAMGHMAKVADALVHVCMLACTHACTYFYVRVCMMCVQHACAKKECIATGQLGARLLHLQPLVVCSGYCKVFSSSSRTAKSSM